MNFCKLHVYDVSSMVYAGTASKFGVDYVDGRKEANNRIKGLAVGGIRRILNDALLNINNGSAVLFVFDSKTDKFKIYPEYKSTREKNMDVIIQREMLVEICDRINIPYVKRDGYEADDLIANIVAQQLDQYSGINIITGDLDLAGNIVDKRVTITGSASIYPSVDCDTFESVVKPGENVPFNTILPYLFFNGKKSNNVRPLLKGADSEKMYRHFIEFSKKYPAGYGSKNGVMAAYIMELYETKAKPQELLDEMVQRMSFVYPLLINEPIPVKRSIKSDINTDELHFFCRMLQLYRASALFGRESIASSMPYTTEMAQFMANYRTMYDSGVIAANEQITPDMSYFVNRTTAFSGNIGDF